jgi:DNA-binding LacI/PurR family transcriptional regulator
MRVRIEDVAKVAGVSMKTVSRVLNHEPNVSERTRQRVQTAVDTLNYRRRACSPDVAHTWWRCCSTTRRTTT